MERPNPSLMIAISKLCVAGEQAGFSLEQMIELLDSGLSVQTLLDLITWRLDGTQRHPATSASSSCWIA